MHIAHSRLNMFSVAEQREFKGWCSSTKVGRWRWQLCHSPPPPSPTSHAHDCPFHSPHNAYKCSTCIYHLHPSIHPSAQDYCGQTSLPKLLQPISLDNAVG